MISNDDVASFSMQMQLPKGDPAVEASSAGAASVSRFEGAMQVAQANEGARPVDGETYGDLSAEAAGSRAATLEVGQVFPAVEVDDNKGDVILDGLSRLRSAFDGQADKVVDVSSSSSSGTEKLIDTQMEIVKYSLLMDVTSKLVGKSTQTFDTLMKGQ